MYYFYILYSDRKNRYYYGHSSNVELRLDRHNDGWTKSTKYGIPWKLVYKEPFSTKGEAINKGVRSKTLEK